MKELTTEQHTYGWYFARLGMFTASQVHKLMGATDMKTNSFASKTADDYISLVAGERKMKEIWNDLADEEKDDFIRTQYPSNKAMDWGTRYESFARNAFSFENDKVISETGSCIKEERIYVSASPDGVIEAENALIEIKCPQLNTFVSYCDTITDAESLKKAKPEYYWQIMLQMYVTDAVRCYFVWYHPHVRSTFFAVIERNEQDIETLLKRIDAAEEIAQRKYNKINKK